METPTGTVWEVRDVLVRRRYPRLLMYRLCQPAEPGAAHDSDSRFLQTVGQSGAQVQRCLCSTLEKAWGGRWDWVGHDSVLVRLKTFVDLCSVVEHECLDIC